MGILDDLKKWAHPYEDEDEEYEDDFPDLRDRGDTGALPDRRSARAQGGGPPQQGREHQRDHAAQGRARQARAL